VVGSSRTAPVGSAEQDDPSRARSSVGQSSGLIIRRSQVRGLPGPPEPEESNPTFATSGRETLEGVTAAAERGRPVALSDHPVRLAPFRHSNARIVGTIERFESFLRTTCRSIALTSGNARIVVP